MFDSEDSAAVVSGRLSVDAADHPLAEIACGLAVFEVDGQSVVRPFGRTTRIVTENGTEVRLDYSELKHVEGTTRRSRGAWPRVGDEYTRKLFDDIAPGPGITCELTLHYITGGDLVTATGKPVQYSVQHSNERASTGRAVRVLRAHEIRIHRGRSSRASRTGSPRLPGTIVSAALATVAGLSAFFFATWSAWGSSTAALAARIGWLTLAFCGFWSSARRICGSTVRAYPEAPEHAWLPQLSARHCGEGESTPLQEGFGASVIAISCALPFR